ncbi:MAG: HD domain-containing protein [Kiritimatiellia bacterium]
MEELPAFDLAFRCHAGQFRKGEKGEPFVFHPLRVAGCLIRHGVQDRRVLEAALLHDVLEDTDCSEAELEQVAGPEVLRWVKELTDRKEYLKSLRKQMQVERAELLSPEAKLIRLADKIDNLDSLHRDPPRGWSWQRRREYVAWADRVVKQMGPVHPGLETEYRRVRELLWRQATGQATL